MKGGVIAGTEKSTGATIPSTLSFVSYGSSADLWGLAWTPADINAPTFGVVYAVKNSPSSTISHYLKATNFGFAIPSGATIKGIVVDIKQQNPDWRGFVDYIRITVYYSP